MQFHKGNDVLWKSNVDKKVLYILLSIVQYYHFKRNIMMLNASYEPQVKA